MLHRMRDANGLIEEPPVYVEKPQGNFGSGQEFIHNNDETPQQQLNRRIKALNLNKVTKGINANIRKGESYKSKHIDPPYIKDEDSLSQRTLSVGRNRPGSNYKYARLDQSSQNNLLLGNQARPKSVFGRNRQQPHYTMSHRLLHVPSPLNSGIQNPQRD